MSDRSSLPHDLCQACSTSHAGIRITGLSLQPAVRKGCWISKETEHCTLGHGVSAHSNQRRPDTTFKLSAGASASHCPSTEGKLRHRQREQLKLIHRAQLKRPLFALGTMAAYVYD